MRTNHIERIVFASTLLSIGLVAFICLHEFLSHQLFNIVLAALTMPFALQVCSEQKGSYRFACLALLFILLSFYMPVSTLVYFSLLSILLFAIEFRFGKVNFAAIMVVLLSMPITTYLANTFSFPIRLRLTSICETIFQAVGIPIEAAGNTFSYEGNDFTVDSACMGLNMLIASFLISILLFGFYQKKYRRKMPNLILVAYLIIVFLLNVFSNLVRIMALVLFRIYPETIMHDVVGIFCFLTQILLPVWALCLLLIKVIPSKKEKQKKIRKPKQTLFQNQYFSTLIHGVCCALLWVTALQVSNKSENNTIVSIPDIPGYTVVPFSQNVLKLENDSSLVYIKQIRWFCDTEHNPMICWKGSGYSLSHIRETILNEQLIYTALLQNGEDILYTAWWYSNGQTSTNSQLHWRRDMLLGSPPYSLLNVTTADESLLESETGRAANSFTDYTKLFSSSIKRFPP